MLNFDSFKGFLILTKLDKLAKLGKFSRKIRQICQLSLSFKKTQLVYKFISLFNDYIHLHVAITTLADLGEACPAHNPPRVQILSF